MSAEKMDVVRQCLAAFERNSNLANAFAEMRALVAPDGEWIEDPSWPGYGTLRGPEEISRYLQAQMDEVWESIRSEFHAMTDVGGDQVVTEVRAHARSRAGVDAELRIAHLWTVRDGLVHRIEWFLDPERAVEEGRLPAR